MLLVRTIENLQVILTFYLITHILPIICTTNFNADSPACNNVKNAYSKKGFDGGEVPQQAILGEHLRVCQKGPTCCTSRMEHQLSTQSREEYDKLLHTSLSKLHAMLNFHAERLDEFFKELMRKTKEEFHQMFLKTYGLLYSENSYIFEDMFKDLETYYLAGRGNLAVAMDAFFTRLYKKMFEKINSQYTFSSSYLECVGSHMSSLKPFGDSPQKMTTEIRRAFIAMRTFVKSLREVRKVVKDMMEVAVFPECSRALMRMTYCPHCYGEPQLPPCPSYCMNVLRGCLAYHADLDPNWNLFVEAMVTLAFQLESAFNLETVIDPLNIKISEAIMNFQENGVAISKKIFEECGQPRLRQKRQVFGEEDEDTTNAAAEVVSGPLQFNYHGSRTPTVRGTSLDRLVVGAKKQLRQTKSFWSHLGDLLCNSNYLRPMPAGNLQPCWDGKTRTLRYPYNVTSPGLASQKTNPEVRMDPTKLNYAVNQKILALKMVATRLSQAYNGLDVHWPMENEPPVAAVDSDDEDDEDFSGSGSGSGDGDLTDPTDDLYFTYSTPPPYNPTKPKRPYFPHTKGSSGASSHLLWPLLLLLAVPVALHIHT